MKRKRLNWIDTEREVGEMKDVVGKPVERKIKPVVVGLRARGINTHDSCGGHLNRGGVAPRVSVGGPNLRVLATRHWEQLDKGLLGVEIAREMEEERKRERLKIEPLVREYNETRNVPDDTRLVVRRDALGSDRIESFGVPAFEQSGGLGIGKRIKVKEYQKEMNEFGRFLKKKFLG
ncbi:hypothetical protein KKC08_03730 [Patescibacteria group bacterium]|nr:hypothetical protein [Patescibacteria group bacterium]MCG2702028.1 hypothetical protein [Candidatus Parcubacteria bacterium]MBU4210846.1 hypothetical protein [Patescibacteria group bacterium]MBU4265548.1 hypothetical protein [Patescibacteria group bacterium]MBU4389877.1 hypothetical protein [Patescibacteria group bacterium]